MKKLLFSAAAFLFTVTNIHGTELILWHAYRGAEKETLEKVIEEYNSNQKEIQVSLLPIPYDAYPDKITAAIPRGKGPDLFIFAHDRLGDWVKSELVEPIDFWVDEELQKKFLPQTVKPLWYEGGLYGLPTAYKSTVLFYNKKLVTNPPKTTQELIEIAKKLTDHEQKKYGLAYEMGLLYYHACWHLGFGGQIFDEKQNPVIYSEAGTKALNFANDLLKTHKIMPQEISNALVTMLFNDQKVGFVISGPWFRAEIKPEIDYGVATLPIISEVSRPATPFVTAEAIFISSKSDHKEEAFELMKYLTSAKVGLTMAIEGMQTVANMEVYENEKVAGDPYIKIFRKQLENTVTTPNIPEMRMVWTPFNNAINNVLTGQMTSEEALKKAQEKIDKAVKEYRK